MSGKLNDLIERAKALRASDLSVDLRIYLDQYFKDCSILVDDLANIEQETILPNKEVKRKYWKEYEAEDYIPDIEQKKLWSKVGAKPEESNVCDTTNVNDIKSTEVLRDSIIPHLNYESPCWENPYDKDSD